MQFAFTEEQLLFRDTLRAMLQKECPPERVRETWENSTGRLPALWRQLAEMGVMGVVASEAFGGLDMSQVTLALLLEEAGRVALSEPLLETAMVAVPLIEAAGDESFKATWLSSIATGETVVAIGLEAERSGWVQNAHIADLLLLQRGDSLHALSPAQVEAVAQTSVDRSRRLFRVAWDPSPETVVAEGPQAVRALFYAGLHGIVGVSAQLLGLGRHMLEMTVEYAKVREQFGKPIGTFQAVKHKAADALLKLEFAHPVVYRAAWSLGQLGPVGQDRNGLSMSDVDIHAAMAKLYATEAADAVSRVALQLHGAIGYTFEFDLQMWMKRTWCLARSWGTAAFHRCRVADAILGEPP